MNKIVMDSGPLISFSDTCLVNIVSFLKKRGAEFFIPKSVEEEIVTTPIKVRKYAFSAVRLHKAIEDGDLKVFSVNNRKVERILSAANQAFFLRGKPLRLLHAGEAECLIACRELSASALVIDEKTTRLLIEDAELLQETISDEYGAEVSVNKRKVKEFGELTNGIEILRSADLAATAAKRGYFSSFGKHAGQAFHTAILALKNAGCSLSEKEVAYYQSLNI